MLDENTRKAIPGILRQIRSTCGISQIELADILDVSKSAVGFWETGDRIPTKKMIDRIITLDIVINNLIAFEQSMLQDVNKGGIKDNLSDIALKFALLPPDKRKVIESLINDYYLLCQDTGKLIKNEVISNLFVKKGYDAPEELYDKAYEWGEQMFGVSGCDGRIIGDSWEKGQLKYYGNDNETNPERVSIDAHIYKNEYTRLLKELRDRSLVLKHDNI